LALETAPGGSVILLVHNCTKIMVKSSCLIIT